MATEMARFVFTMSVDLPADLTQEQIDYMLMGLVAQVEEPVIGLDESGNEIEVASDDVHARALRLHT